MGVIIRSLQSRRSKYNVTLVLAGRDICPQSRLEFAYSDGSVFPFLTTVTLSLARCWSCFVTVD
jgi:hypothetical protein